MKNYSQEEIKQFKKRALDLIPGGAHTYSKSDYQFSSNAPAFIQKGEGAICMDLAGNEYIDYGMALSSVTLGHAYPEVTQRIKDNIDNGNSFARPTLLEGELAEVLCDLIPCAEMVKFAKNGSDVTSAAVRLSRAYTGRNLIVRIREQPFHSFNDWFIGSTSIPGGVPETTRKQILKTSYNDIQELRSLFDNYPEQIAAVIMEPATFEVPENGFLEEVRRLCTEKGVVLVFDEIITGFRWHLSGAQTFYGVTPDLATFSKAMSNGFACAALVGKRDIMRLGSVNGPVWLLSCTNGSESVGLCAALATIEVFKNEDVIEHIWNYGKQLQGGMNDQIEELGLEPWMHVRGYPCRPDLVFKTTELCTSFELKTLLFQEMMKHYVLMDRFSISYSHREEELKKTLESFYQAFKVIKKALESKTVKQHIAGDVIQPVFSF